MRLLVVVALIAAVCAAVQFQMPLAPHVTKEMVDAINNQDGVTWKATTEPGKLIKGATTAQIKKLLGVLDSPTMQLPQKTFTQEELAAAPESFDSATHWPHCATIPKIPDQSACGSCWAVAAASAMSDRMCTNGINNNLSLSAANLMSCCTYCGFGCDGGVPEHAWAYWKSTGLLSAACDPYPFPKCANNFEPNSTYPKCPKDTYPTPPCLTKCNVSNVQPKYYKGVSSYSVSGEDKIMAEVSKNGPIEVAFSVYGDFPTYKSGVYKKTSDKYLGGHAVRLVGWGELNGVKYWKIANSWNKDWGMDGYFLILRGVNECNIEQTGVAGMAK